MDIDIGLLVWICLERQGFETAVASNLEACFSEQKASYLVKLCHFAPSSLPFRGGGAKWQSFVLAVALMRPETTATQTWFPPFPLQDFKRIYDSVEAEKA